MRFQSALLTIIASAAALSACAARQATAPPAPQPSANAEPALETPRAITPEPKTAVGSVTPGGAADFANAAQDRVFFDFDQHALTPQARETLAAQAEWLNRFATVRVLIEGNADERGTREYNLALGGRRASADRDFLISRGGDARRITTVSYGKDRPIDPRSNDAGWALNRNARTTLINPITS